MKTFSSFLSFYTCFILTLSRLANISLLESKKFLRTSKLFIILILTSIATSILRTAKSVAKTEDIYVLPPCVFLLKVIICDLKFSYFSSDAWERNFPISNVYHYFSYTIFLQIQFFHLFASNNVHLL